MAYTAFPHTCNDIMKEETWIKKRCNLLFLHINILFEDLLKYSYKSVNGTLIDLPHSRRGQCGR